MDEHLCLSLRRAGWLPHDVEHKELLIPACGENLLPWIAARWQQSESRPPPKLAQWLQASRDRGGELWRWRSPLTEMCDERLLFWPQPPPPRLYVGILSSHLGRNLESRRNWFAALRSLCVDESNATLLAAGRMTVRPFLERAATILDRRLLLIDVPQSRPPSVHDWLGRIARLPPTSTENGNAGAELSPPLVASTRPSAWSVADELVCTLSDYCYLLRLRSGGRLEKLLAQWLRASAATPLRLATGNELVTDEAASRFAECGATVWREFSTVPSFPVRYCGVPPDCDASALPAWAYLTHCTRYVDGPWPDQCAAEYADDLLLDRPGAEHSPLAALLRICAQRRLIASSQAIRGGWPVVCFTAVPLDDLAQLRGFRPHRQRFDFPPYGLCIRREWLMARGAKPVLYGDQQLWSSLARDEQMFFQLAQSRPALHGDRRYDWRREQEWRIAGDVDLSQLDADSGLLFAPTAREARLLAMLSRWPVITI